jgi:dTDP-4-dehydrorhamnose 3,5-epimerase
LKAAELLANSVDLTSEDCLGRQRIEGVFKIETECFSDSRGIVGPIWERDWLLELGIEFNPDSSVISQTHRKGTLRGLHFQIAPFSQAKLVSCIAGCAFDVVVDLRPESPSYLRWTAATLLADSGRVIYVPHGCAHGYLTLSADVVLIYLLEGAYVPKAASVLRWDDPTFSIPWPLSNPHLSDKDRFASNFHPYG